MRPIVYGCFGFAKISWTSPSSTTRPGVHHDDPVGELGDEAEVVGDEEGRRVGLALGGSQDLHDLRLDRDVERRRGLVGDEDPRLRSRSPSRSSRAGACRPRTRAGTARRAARRTARRRARGARSSSLRAALSLMSGWCVCSASAIWSPIVNTGFSDVIGSWKIIAISPPRISRSSFFGSLQEIAPAVQRLALASRGPPE